MVVLYHVCPTGRDWASHTVAQSHRAGWWWPPDRFLILLQIEWRGKPLAIRGENGPEYVSSTLMTLAEKQGTALTFI